MSSRPKPAAWAGSSPSNCWPAWWSRTFRPREADQHDVPGDAADPQRLEPAGAANTIRFHLNDMDLLALNGGGYFGKFYENLFFYVSCATQIDRLHEAL